MQTNIVQLKKNEHAHIALSNLLDLRFTAKENLLPVILQETAPMSTVTPLIFVKDAKTGQFTMVAIAGLEKGQNLFVEDGLWIGAYLPSIITHLPLGISFNPEDESQFVIVIDTESTLIVESGGERLFKEDGTETDYFLNRIEILKNYYGCNQITRDFINTIVDLELLELQEFSWEKDGEKQQVSGMYIVSEKKLNELSLEKIGKLRENGFLAGIYHHLASISNFKKLVDGNNNIEEQ